MPYLLAHEATAQGTMVGTSGVSSRSRRVQTSEAPKEDANKIGSSKQIEDGSFRIYLANMMMNAHGRKRRRNAKQDCVREVGDGKGERLAETTRGRNCQTHTEICKGQWLPLSSRLERTAGFGCGKCCQLSVSGSCSERGERAAFANGGGETLQGGLNSHTRQFHGCWRLSSSSRLEYNGDSLCNLRAAPYPAAWQKARLQPCLHPTI